MKREVITYNAIEGFHRYPDAPGFCDFLGKRHRHFCLCPDFVWHWNGLALEVRRNRTIVWPDCRAIWH